MPDNVLPTKVKATWRMLIVDDHPLYSDAIVSTLHQSFTDCEIHTAGSLSKTLSLLDGGLSPDFVMLDLKLPDVTGISGFEQIQKRLENARVLVVSALASTQLVGELLNRGAMGFLPKESSAATMRYAVQEVMQGRRYVPKEYRAVADGIAAGEELCSYDATPQLSTLTPQQKRILKLICAGKPNKLIAYELSLAETTVKAHITALLRRLGVSNRTQAAVLVESLTALSGDSSEVRAFLKN